MKIDTWPRWALLALSSVAIFAIGFFVNQTWWTVTTVQKHIPIATLSFESMARTTNELWAGQEKLSKRQEEVLRKLIALETRVELSRNADDSADSDSSAIDPDDMAGERDIHSTRWSLHALPIVEGD